MIPPFPRNARGWGTRWVHKSSLHVHIYGGQKRALFCASVADECNRLRISKPASGSSIHCCYGVSHLSDPTRRRRLALRSEPSGTAPAGTFSLYCCNVVHRGRRWSLHLGTSLPKGAGRQRSWTVPLSSSSAIPGRPGVCDRAGFTCSADGIRRSRWWGGPAAFAPDTTRGGPGGPPAKTSAARVAAGWGRRTSFVENGLPAGSGQVGCSDHDDCFCD